MVQITVVISASLVGLCYHGLSLLAFALTLNVSAESINNRCRITLIEQFRKRLVSIIAVTSVMLNT